METEKKTVTVEIPEGKKAVWNEQGVLQLVDDEPKDITERIKTFYDALIELKQWAERGDCEAQKLIEEYDSIQRMEASDDITAYMQLRVIAAALNENWKPQFTKDEKRWFPYFILWTKNEIDNMSDVQKDIRDLMLWDDSAYSSSYTNAYTQIAIFSSRLAYKSQELAEYAARQFASVYARYFIGEKAIGALPWREFEQKHKSSGNK